MLLFFYIKMKFRKVIVTGGCGFIGSHLVDKLIENSEKVIVIDNLSYSTTRYIEKHVENGVVDFVKADVRNLNLMKKITREVDAVFHMAAQPDVRLSVKFPLKDFSCNTIGTLTMLEACRINDVEKFIFASSGGTIYGLSSKPAGEDHPLDPISIYGASKASCEMYLRAYSYLYGIKAVSLRYGNIYGPRSTRGVIYDFFMKLRSNPKKLTVLGDGMQCKSYLYISDCVEATLLVAKAETGRFDAFNVSSPEVITVRKIAKIVIETLGLKDVAIEYTGGKAGWPGDVYMIRVDCSKLFSLGWKIKVPFKKGVEMYIKWLINEYGFPKTK
ncbi:UDP-glucose 4-epimerase [archaeon]|nr:MAG: UDP-glucose 4-epimerase [archaeon]